MTKTRAGLFFVTHGCEKITRTLQSLTAQGVTEVHNEVASFTHLMEIYDDDILNYRQNNDLFDFILSYSIFATPCTSTSLISKCSNGNRLVF